MLHRRERTKLFSWSAMCAVLVLVVIGVAVWHHRRCGSLRQVLPTNLAQWQAYEGNWASRDGVLTDRAGGRGDKLMTGDTALNDFTYRADLRFDSERGFEFGDAGLVIRASNLSVGTDSLYGYYVGLRPGTQTLKLGRMQDEYIDLALRKLATPIAIHSWYHIYVQARGCTFAVEVKDESNRIIGVMHEEDRDCVIRAGQLGLRSYGMIASWRALSVETLE